MKPFLSWYKPYRGLLAADLICAALTAALALTLPLCVRHITRDILEAGLPYAAPSIIKTGLLMLAIIAAQTACAFFYDYKGHDMGAKIERDMRLALFTHLQKFSFSFFDGRRTGDLMSRLTNDLNGLAELYHHGPENIFIHGAQFIGAFIILLTINTKLTLVACAALPVMAVYSFVFYRRLQGVYTQSRSRIADINDRAEENLAGARVVRAFTNEPLEINKFAALNERFYRSRAGIYKHEALHYTIIDKCLAPLVMVGIAVFGGLWIDGGSLTAADLITFILYASYLTGPIPQLAFMVQQYQEGLSGYRRFRELMDKEPEIKSPNACIPFPRAEGRVTFDNIAFTYDEGQPLILSGISLDVAPGTTVAVVGRSGAGKTTLCTLIPRFYDVLEGAVYVDGVDVRDADLSQLRGRIGIVQQETFLFAGTVMENILYGRPGATREEAVAAAKRADAHGFITALVNGYDTEIGQRGAKLSGGQRQRICIARVFLKDPPILILDEATGSLDYESERAVTDSIASLSKGRTTFIITHRLTLVQKADIILALGSQGAVECGTHESLLQHNGEYAALYAAGERSL